MGFLSFLRDKVEDFICAAEVMVSTFIDKISKKGYNEDNIEDHIDVDAILADLREPIEKKATEVETECMKAFSSLFSELTVKTKEKFPDLVELIDEERRKAERELKGTIMKYVKEHLSKNDPEFLEVLKMQPGKDKEAKLNIITQKILSDAERKFDKKLKQHIEYLLTEFTNRLDTRIVNQEKYMNQRIVELQKLQKDAEKGQIDINVLKDNSMPIIESAECIISLLEMEM